jgi:hypothetical protein
MFELAQFRHATASLQQQLEALLDSPPAAQPQSPEEARQKAKWRRTHRELQAQLAREDDLFHSPLDSEWGERPEPLPLWHWLAKGFTSKELDRGS